MITVKTDLNDANYEFYLARSRRMEQKEDEGFIGWDDPEGKDYFTRRIKVISVGELTQKKLMDMANFCSFIWNLIEKDKKLK